MDTISGLPHRKDSVLACVQDGHCHEPAVLKEVEEDMLASLPLEKREARPSFFVMLAGYRCWSSFLVC
jgi:hypothetical protein